MNEVTCTRASLLEASFDDRLGPSEHASMDRHLETCASCANVLRDLHEIRHALRSSVKDITPLEHQRARLAMLRGAATPLARRKRPMVLFAIAATLVPVAVWAASSIVSWRAPQSEQAPVVASAPAAPASAPPPTILEVPSPTAPPTATTTGTATSTATAPTAPKAPIAKAPAEPSAASREFAEAMNAVARGDFAAGASKLRAFAAAHPGDPRTEEATYLEAIALERAGRVAEARAAARRYLAAYPEGAHRAPAQRLAGD